MAEQATVVNIRDFRQDRPLPRDVVRIDRPSRWGNPFRIGAPYPSDEPGATIDRAGAIWMYRISVRSRMLNGEIPRGFFEPLRGKRLACWCAPLACHGDIIREALDAPSIDEWLAADHG